jgi:DNA-binding response OmpR family regulator
VSLAWDLRRRRPALPIVILSAVLNQWDQDDLRDCGVNTMLRKPCPSEEILSVVGGLLQGRMPSAGPAPIHS